MPLFHPVGLMNANRSVFGVNLGHMWGESEMVAGWMSTLLDGVDEGWVRPHVDREFAFDDAREAHAYIEDRRSTGKVVLTT
jgi:NADPH:quinone reductase-like Zn-dependent oxidoreductase